MNNYQPRKRIKPDAAIFKRRAKRGMQRHRQRRGRFFLRMVQRRRYWLARRKMRGHPDMTLRQGMMRAIYQQMKLA